MANLSIVEMAEILSKELNNSIEYVNLPVEAWGQVLAGVDGMSASLEAFVHEHRRAFAATQVAA